MRSGSWWRIDRGARLVRDVCAVVVSWNTKDLLRECLGALTAQGSADRVQAICIDNGSTDGSVDLVMREFPWIELITNQENVGFARACNQGIVLAMEKYAAAYVALVNSDAVVGPAEILALVATMADRPEVAAVGAALRLPDGRLQTGAAGFAATAWSGVCHFLFLSALAPRWCRGFIINQRHFAGHPQPVPVDWVSGACMVTRAAAIRQVGLLDSRFFMYGEDVEWCQRMRRAAFSVWYVPRVHVLHRHGGSAARASPRWLASACELVRRDRGQLEYLVFRMAAALGLSARRVLYALAYLASREERYRRLSSDMGVYARWAIGLG
jgi:GT2 family glycosyltransferase